MTPITEENIDSMYDVLETLNVANGALFNGDASIQTQQSLSWLLGSMSKRVRDCLELLETLQTEQLEAKPCA